MPLHFETLEQLRANDFDMIIDVRSPAEFAQDHIPGAINLPALSNEERAQVGTIYVQDNPFNARKVGASLVLNNVAKHIAGPLQAYDGSWRPLIYCWRGGQRSGVFAALLREVGWRAENIEGGYQTYRRFLFDQLYKSPMSHRLVLLDGNTGTAKTALLNKLKARGVQTIDLEKLAGHRGSLLGALPEGQPSQRKFESELSAALCQLDPERPTLIEAESAKIGRINLPPQLWNAMIAAPRINVTAPMAARADFISQDYAVVLQDPDTVKTRLAPLRRIRGHSVVDHWQDLQDAGAYRDLAEALMRDHYDPAYAKSRRHRAANVIGTVSSQTLCDSGQNALSYQIIKLLKSL